MSWSNWRTYSRNPGKAPNGIRGNCDLFATSHIASKSDHVYKLRFRSKIKKTFITLKKTKYDIKLLTSYYDH